MMLVHRRAVASGLGVGLAHVRAMLRVPVIADARVMVNPRLRVDPDNCIRGAAVVSLAGC
jgi:hypothetical protein